MTMRPDLFYLLLSLGAASLLCRIGGFWIMRFVPITPRLEAALKATPLAVMIGIVAPVAARGNPVEIVALAATAIAMKLLGNDLLSLLVGVGVVALGRYLQLAA